MFCFSLSFCYYSIANSFDVLLNKTPHWSIKSIWNQNFIFRIYSGKTNRRSSSNSSTSSQDNNEKENNTTTGYGEIRLVHANKDICSCVQEVVDKLWPELTHCAIENVNKSNADQVFSLVLQCILWNHLILHSIVLTFVDDFDTEFIAISRCTVPTDLPRKYF